VTGFTKTDKSTFEFAAGYSKVRVIFYRDDIFRIWLAPDGEFTNPAGNAIVVDYGVKNPSVSVSQNAQYYALKSKDCVLRVYKNPMRFAMYDKTNKQVIWEEAEPLYFGSRTVQTLKEQPNEYFYGGGMQNGRFSHAGKVLEISNGGGWNDGAHPNPAPFYMSSAGYGTFRNTFAPGRYAFAGDTDTIARAVSELSHRENRFDAFYFYGPSLKKVLDKYTDITGKPFMPALWMLTVGDANCYNKPEQRLGWTQNTPDVIPLVADKYVEHDMPRGWILPTDGYGCGYTELPTVVKELEKRGFKTGLWTENGVDKIAWEVGQAGTRLCKLDVAWVGSGYEFALNGAKSAFEGIENNTNERGFVWTVCGWAGTQRYATVWSGDQRADWDYIRWHIPTVIGSGLSAQNAATSDIDGIFGGSSRTYVRDLQWKCFTPITMSMSGWADVNKQPWVFDYPYTDINRKFLKLKMRLNPYAYTACYEAHTTGVPMVRAMVLEYPNDPVTYGPETGYQFMSGPSMLVAPVYKRGNVRDSIYLPEGQWFDYWTGEALDGARWLDKYTAKMDVCPVFIREGAIIPMYPEMNYVWEKPTDELTLDLYPAGGNTSYELYEDDFITRDYKKGAFARTLISMSVAKDQSVSVKIDKARGDYPGRWQERPYILDMRSTAAPSQVTVNGTALKPISLEDFQAGKSGWVFDADDRMGRVKVRTARLSTNAAQTIVINY
jgi:alpha-glucosidase (family GH31 glycosyl hydrolase)